MTIDSIHIFIFSLLFLIFLSLRVYAAMVNKVANDTWFHLLVAAKIREQRKLPDKIDNFIYDDFFDYPPLLHVILALFSKKFLEKYHWYFSIVFDLIGFFLVFVITYDIYNINSALLACFLYSIMPTLLGECNNLNTRPIGTLMFSLTIIPLFYFILSSQYLFLVIGLFFGCMLLLSHKFSTQAMAILLISLSIIEKEFIYFIFLLIIILLAVVVSKKRYLKILKGHLAIFSLIANKDWSDYTKMRSSHTVPSKKTKKSNEKLKTVILGIYKNHWNLFVIFCTVFYIPNYSEFELLFVYWIIIMFIIYLLVFFTIKLKFVGPNHRYLENSSVAVAIISAKLLVTLDYIAVKLLFAFCIILSLCAYYYACKIETKMAIEFMLTDSLLKVFEYIKKSHKETVVCIPHTFSYLTAYWTNKKVLAVSSSLALEKAYSDGFINKNPHDVNFDKILELHNISFIIINTRMYKVDELGLPERYKSVEQEGDYILLEDG